MLPAALPAPVPLAVPAGGTAVGPVTEGELDGEPDGAIATVDGFLFANTRYATNATTNTPATMYFFMIIFYIRKHT
jgi:hypothetical protein